MSYFIFAISLALFAWTYVNVRRERQRIQAMRREVEGAVDELVLAAEEAVRTLEEKHRELAAVQVAVPAAVPVATPEPPTPTPEEVAPKVKPRDPLHTQVLALANEGKAMAEIARETGLTTGKVELILNISKLAG